MTDSFNQPGFLNFVVANYSGARPWIADFSGLPIETQEWSGQRFVKAWISGQAVTTSVSVSLSGVALNVSGNVVYLTSGQNNVQNSGQVVYLVSGHNEIQGSFSANVSGNMVSISGQPVSVSGNVVVASVTTNISGQVVYLASGQNNAQISGQTVQIAGGVSVSGNVVKISGETVQIAGGVSVSGNVVIAEISGQTVQIAGGINVSGSPVRISGETIYPVSGLAFVKIFDPSGVQYLDAWTNASGQHRILTSISGETILASVSGNLVLASISGNMVSISGQPVSVSGNVVRVSGERVIVGDASNNIVVLSPADGMSPNQQVQRVTAYMAAFETTTSGFVRLRATASGEGISGVHHKLIVTFSGDPVSISGQALSVSGNMVSVSGQPVSTSVSGNMVSISGQAISVSGNVVVASVTTNISGQTVYLASGQNAVQNSGQTVYPVSGKGYMQIFDPSGAQWVDLWNDASGSHNLAIVANVETNISGQVVYLVSGHNDVQMSGQVVLISGQTVVASVTTNISGQTVYLVSGQAPVFNYGFIDASGQWTQLRVTQSGQTISGIPHKFVVTFSGDSIIGSVSGNMVSVSGQAIRVSGNMVSVSGQAVTVSGNVVLVSGQLVAVSGLVATSVSGNMVTISGQVVTVSGNVVNTSGQINYDFGTTLRTTSGTIVTSLSGGTELGSGIVLNVTVRNLSGNNVMYVGGASGTGHEPFSGKGMLLFGNESQTFEIDNFNKVRLFANTSGQRVRCIGVGV
jgi:hypothetical protein